MDILPLRMRQAANLFRLAYGLLIDGLMTKHTTYRKRIRLHKGWFLASCAVSLLVAGPAYSNGEDDGFVMGKAGKRFYALPATGSTEAGLMGAKVVTPVKRTLYSDAAAMRGGFMRMDRNKLAGPRRVIPASVAKKEEQKTPASENSDMAMFEMLLNNAAAKQDAETPGRISYQWPLPASVKQYISSGYGMRKDPFHGQPRFHGGLDIAAPEGTSVLASADGRVKDAGTRKGFGNYVTLTHADGSETMYNHLQKALARVGTWVRSGQEIGKVGSTGRSTGPHLDYRLKINNEKRDPMTALAGKMPETVGKGATQFAARASEATPNVRTQNGVRIIAPRERVAMSGGFIRVR